MHANSMPNVQVGPTKDEKNLIKDGTPICKVKFNQPSYWLYSVPNLLVFQHLVTLYLGGFVVRVISEIEC